MPNGNDDLDAGGGGPAERGGGARGQGASPPLTEANYYWNGSAFARLPDDPNVGWGPPIADMSELFDDPVGEPLDGAASIAADLVLAAASQTTAAGMDAANTNVLAFIDRAASSHDRTALTAVIAEIRDYTGTDNSGLVDLYPVAAGALRMIDDPAGERVRRHFALRGDQIDGDEAFGSPISDRFKQGLAILKTERVGELYRQLAYINIYTPGTGEIPEGSFLAGPYNGFQQLERLNAEHAAASASMGIGSAIASYVVETEASARLATIESERETLLAFPGVPPSPELATARADVVKRLFGQSVLVDRRQNEWVDSAWQGQPAVFVAYVPLGPRARTLLPTIPPPGPLSDDADEAYLQARARYLDSLSADPLLTAEVEIAGIASGPLWRVLLTLDGAISDDGDFARLADDGLTQALSQLAGHVRSEIDRIGDLTTAEELIREFGQPLYRPLLTRLTGPLTPVYGSGFTRSFGNALRDRFRQYRTDDAYWDDASGSLRTGGQLVVAAGSFVLPFIFVPVGFILAATDVAFEASATHTAWRTVTTAEAAAAAGGSVTRAPIGGYLDLLQTRSGSFVFAAALLPTEFLGLADVASGLRWGSRALAGADDAVAAAKLKAAAEVAELGENADVIVRGLPARVTETDDAAGVLARLDEDFASRAPTEAGGPRYAPGDAEFFKRTGLQPRHTVDTGGQRFHLSAPFRGPEGKIAVIAFQETSAGTVVPRLFYSSGEHGIWRVAPSVGMRLDKGPTGHFDMAGRRVEPRVDKTQEQLFVNEAAVDLTPELQGAVGRWIGGQPVIENLHAADAGRAFYGSIPNKRSIHGEEFARYVSLDDVEQPLLANGRQLDDGLQPDLAKGPLDRWGYEHHLYGPVEGFLYQSQDGSTLYVVLRNAKGEVWVPSIQYKSVAVTPFGTSFETPLTDLNAMPLMHGEKTYVSNPLYKNSLNQALAEALPPPVAIAPVVPATAGKATATVVPSVSRVVPTAARVSRKATGAGDGTEGSLVETDATDQSADADQASTGRQASARVLASGIVAAIIAAIAIGVFFFAGSGSRDTATAAAPEAQDASPDAAAVQGQARETAAPPSDAEPADGTNSPPPTGTEPGPQDPASTDDARVDEPMPDRDEDAPDSAGGGDLGTAADFFPGPAALAASGALEGDVFALGIDPRDDVVECGGSTELAGNRGADIIGAVGVIGDGIVTVAVQMAQSPLVSQQDFSSAVRVNALSRLGPRTFLWETHDRVARQGEFDAQGNPIDGAEILLEQNIVIIRFASDVPPAALSIDGFNAASPTDPTGCDTALIVADPFPEPPSPLPGDCEAIPMTACLSNSRFAVQASIDGTPALVQDGFEPGDGVAFATEATTTPALRVRVVNACGLSNAYWVIADAAAPLAASIQVTDTATGQTNEYVNTLGPQVPALVDTGLFDTCP